LADFCAGIFAPPTFAPLNFAPPTFAPPTFAPIFIQTIHNYFLPILPNSIFTKIKNSILEHKDYVFAKNWCNYLQKRHTKPEDKIGAKVGGAKVGGAKVAPRF
jgi:hypothetical protein